MKITIFVFSERSASPSNSVALSVDHASISTEHESGEQPSMDLLFSDVDTSLALESNNDADGGSKSKYTKVVEKNISKDASSSEGGFKATVNILAKIARFRPCLLSILHTGFAEF